VERLLLASPAVCICTNPELLLRVCRAALSGGLGAVIADPVVDVVGSPDFALGKVGYGLREVGAARDLVYALPADSAQADPDFMGADETDPSRGHAS
jgi:hypothetical protein